MVRVCMIQSVRQECSDLTQEISLERVLIYIYIYIYIYICICICIYICIYIYIYISDQSLSHV